MNKETKRKAKVKMTKSELREFELLWAEMDEIAKEVSKTWEKGVSAAQAVADDRR